MSIVHVVGTGGSIASERTLFVGTRIPQEIKRLPKYLKNIDHQTFTRILKVLLHDLKGSEVTEEHFHKLQDGTLSEENLAFIYSGLHRLLQCALRISINTLKPEAFKEDLLELRIPPELVEDISTIVFGPRRPQLDAHRLDAGPRLPRLDTFQWRVDVGISTSVLNRVLEPSVVTDMTLSDGKIHSFEISVSKFHELRYNVAQVLREMEDLEKRGILKIE